MSPDHLTDQTLDRVANKVAEGTPIQNINGYCHKVAQFIFLEWINRQHDHKHEPIDDPASLQLVQPSSDDYLAEEDRLECQRSCLRELPPDSRDVIKEYFTGEGRDRINRREAMATRLGITRTALGNRITRLLNKLRECERKCLKSRLA